MISSIQKNLMYIDLLPQSPLGCTFQIIQETMALVNFWDHKLVLKSFVHVLWVCTLSMNFQLVNGSRFTRPKSYPRRFSLLSGAAVWCCPEHVKTCVSDFSWESMRKMIPWYGRGLTLMQICICKKRHGKLVLSRYRSPQVCTALLRALMCSLSVCAQASRIKHGLSFALSIFVARGVTVNKWRFWPAISVLWYPLFEMLDKSVKCFLGECTF